MKAGILCSISDTFKRFLYKIIDFHVGSFFSFQLSPKWDLLVLAKPNFVTISLALSNSVYYLLLFHSLNLYELIKRNNYQGFSLGLIRRFAFSLIQCLRLLDRENIIHCDLKPVSYTLHMASSISNNFISKSDKFYWMTKFIN